MDTLRHSETTMDDGETRKLYIVRSFGGMYDDSWSHNVAVSADEAKAIAYVAREEKSRDECKVADQHMRQWSERYRIEHPFPTLEDAMDAWYVHMESAYHQHFLTTFGQEIMDKTSNDYMETCWAVDAVVAL